MNPTGSFKDTGDDGGDECGAPNAGSSGGVRVDWEYFAAMAAYAAVRG